MMNHLRTYSSSLQNGNPFEGYRPDLLNGSSYADGLESGGNNMHAPYVNHILGIHSNNYLTVVSQSVMFECTASVRNADGLLLKEYTAEQAVMFILTPKS